MELSSQIIGWIAASLSMILFIPQVIRILKEKNVNGLSFVSYSVLTVGTHMWILMGAMTSLVQPMVTNLFIGVLLMPFFYFFIKNKAILISVYAVMVLSFATSLAIFFVSSFEISSAIDLVVTIIAGSGTSFAFFPQTLRVVKTKETGNISLATTIIMMVSNSVWVIYWVLSMMINVQLSVIFALIFSAIAAIMQMPVAYVMFAKKFKKV